MCLELVKFARFRRGTKFANLGDNRHVAVISHPDRWLMGADEPRDRRVIVVIRRDANPVLSRLRSPTRHAERRRYKRHGAAVPENAALRANQWIHIRRRIVLGGQAREGNCREHNETNCKPLHDGELYLARIRLRQAAIIPENL